MADHKNRIRELVAALDPQTVLDCGCGEGFFTDCFHRNAYLGVDINPGIIEFAKGRHPGYRFENRSINSVTGRFDLILLSNVLHHVAVSDREALVADCAGRLTAKGVLVIIEVLPVARQKSVVLKTVLALEAAIHSSAYLSPEALEQLLGAGLRGEFKQLKNFYLVQVRRTSEEVA